jgi:hypothetical protein
MPRRCAATGPDRQFWSYGGRVDDGPPDLDYSIGGGTSPKAFSLIREGQVPY